MKLYTDTIPFDIEDMIIRLLYKKRLNLSLGILSTPQRYFGKKMCYGNAFKHFLSPDRTIYTHHHLGNPRAPPKIYGLRLRWQYDGCGTKPLMALQNQSYNNEYGVIRHVKTQFRGNYKKDRLIEVIEDNNLMTKGYKYKNKRQLIKIIMNS
jgi:hypothetical protein